MERTDDILRVANLIAKEGNRQKKGLSDKLSLYKLIVVSISILLAISIICATIFAVSVFKEQQWAMNMWFNDMAALVSGTEKEVYQAEADSNGTAIVGDSNTLVGGDLTNGESDIDKD